MSGKFENIVIVSDIDGTYLARNEEGDRRNREAIEYFKSNGGHFTFATGRTVSTFFHAIPDAVELINLPVICCNGGYIYDVWADRQIASYPMEHRLVFEIQRKFAELEKTEGCREAASEFKQIYYKHKSYTENAVEKYLSEIVATDLYEIMSPKEWEDYEIYKIIFVGEKQAVTNMRKRIDPLFCGRADISQASASYYEYNAYGVNKASGIDSIIKTYFPDKKMTVCAVGDHDNDIKMIEYADFGCCPENANDNVKAASDRIFCNCKDGVIADMIEYFDRQ